MRCKRAESLLIQSLTPTSDTQGGRSTTPSTVATVRAELVQSGAGTERLQAQHMGAIADYRFRIRVRTDVSPTMLATWTPRWPVGQSALVLEIHNVIQEPSTHSLILECGVRK